MNKSQKIFTLSLAVIASDGLTATQGCGGEGGIRTLGSTTAPFGQ
jgi:hypothetical protein